MSRDSTFFALFQAFTLGYTTQTDYSKSLGSDYARGAWWYFFLGTLIVLLISTAPTFKRNLF